MKHFDSLFVSLLSALLIPLGAMAQTGKQHSAAELRTQFGKAKTVVQTENHEHPLLSKMKIIQPRQQGPFHKVDTKLRRNSMAAVPKLAPRKARHSSEFWATVSHRTEWGIGYRPQWDYYSTTAPCTFGIVNNDADWLAKGSGAILNDSLYFVKYDPDPNYGYIKYVKAYVGSTPWNVIDSRQVTDYQMIATETAIDPTNNKPFGCFFNANADGYELGYADYTTWTRTTVATTSLPFVALGFSADGTCYGVATDGNLYRINTQTGAETKIGSTGITVSSTDGSFYAQTGEISPADGVFYWAAVDADANSALLTVNLTSGQASKVYDMPDGDQLAIMYFPQKEANAKAPSVVTDLKFDFGNGLTTGTAKFTMPHEYYDGSEMSGSISYSLCCDGEEIATGQANAGATVSVDVSTTTGSHFFTLTTTNDNGTSPVAKQQMWVGFDQPMPVTNAQMTADGLTVTVSWTAPSRGVHNGYMGPLTYTVVRKPDGKVVADNITTTTITDQIPEQEVAGWKYVICAKNGDVVSDSVTTNKEVLGSPIVPPYLMHFQSANDLDTYTIINAEKNGWEWNIYRKLVDCSHYAYDTKIDDWLLTPEFHFAANTRYKIRFISKSITYEGQTDDPQKLSLMVGTGLDPTTYTETLMEPTPVYYNAVNTVFNLEYTSQKDQYAHLAFHVTGPVYYNYITLDSVQIEAGVSLNAPDSVQAIQIAPAEQGVLKATLQFNAPSKTLGGETLSSLTGVKIFRDDQLVTTVPAQPGQAVTYQDETPSNGFNTYKLVAVNADGDGVVNSATKYIGMDVPDVSSLNAILSDPSADKYNLDWQKPSYVGAHGGYVVPDDATYSLYNVTMSVLGPTIGSRIVSGLTNTHYSIDGTPDEGDMGWTIFGISAANSAGETDPYATSQIMIGKPYELPFRESFSTNGSRSYCWYGNTNAGDKNIPNISYSSSDEIGGSFQWVSYGGLHVDFGLGKTNIQQASDPVLAFEYYAVPGKKFTITPMAICPCNDTITFNPIDFSTLTGEEGWRTAEYSLATDNNRYAIPMFRFQNNEEVGPSLKPETFTVNVDNVNVIDLKDHDLGVTINSTEKVKVDEKASWEAKVFNYGENTTNGSDYKVKFYVGDSLVDTKDGQDLDFIKSATYEFEYTPRIVDKEEMPVRVVIEFADDQNSSNNEATTTLDIIKPKYQTVIDLRAQAADKGAQLTWTAPTVDGTNVVTEGFEDYTPFVGDAFGDWTGLNATGSSTAGIRGLSFGNMTGYEGFFVMNPEQAGANYDTYPFLAPYDGKQYAMSFATYDQGWYDFNTDHWLFSPELSGREQTIGLSMAALSSDTPEDVEFLYSTTDRNTDSFTSIEKKQVTGVATGNEDEGWEEFTFDVPEGAKYFAIRHTTFYGYGLIIDDIAYETGGPQKILHYNIYRDGVLIGSSDEPGFTDANAPAGSHVYNVTVVYDLGESDVSNDATITITGINSIEADAQGEYNVYTLGGQALRLHAKSLRGIQPGAYVINGKKYIVK